MKKNFFFLPFLLLSIPCIRLCGLNRPVDGQRELQRPLHQSLAATLSFAQHVIEKSSTPAAILFANEIVLACADLKKIEETIASLPVIGYKAVRKRFEQVGATIISMEKGITKPEGFHLKHAYWLNRSVTKLKTIAQKRLYTRDTKYSSYHCFIFGAHEPGHCSSPDKAYRNKVWSHP